jgi:hypothetical protein
MPQEIPNYWAAFGVCGVKNRLIGGFMRKAQQTPSSLIKLKSILKNFTTKAKSNLRFAAHEERMKLENLVLRVPVRRPSALVVYILLLVLFFLSGHLV